jgi:hypothetical protein
LIKIRLILSIAEAATEAAKLAQLCPKWDLPNVTILRRG